MDSERKFDFDEDEANKVLNKLYKIANTLLDSDTMEPKHGMHKFMDPAQIALLQEIKTIINEESDLTDSKKLKDIVQLANKWKVVSEKKFPPNLKAKESKDPKAEESKESDFSVKIRVWGSLKVLKPREMVTKLVDKLAQLDSTGVSETLKEFSTLKDNFKKVVKEAPKREVEIQENIRKQHRSTRP